MEQASGVVIEQVNANIAKVKIDRKTMCGENCAACGQICGSRATVVLAENKINAKQGDPVIVQIPTSKGFQAMLFTYGIPILYTFLLVACMGTFLSETLGAIFLLSGIVLWFFLLWILEKKGVFFAMFKTQIIRIQEHNDEKTEHHNRTLRQR